jgi:glutamate-1-semialdehyde 2,1-aminomutase
MSQKGSTKGSNQWAALRPQTGTGATGGARPTGQSPDPGSAPAGRNAALFARAQQSIPGGVNSPVRAFRSVGGTPRFIARGQGPHIWDADGRRYIDLVCSWGPMILGHAHPAVLEAVNRAARDGLSFGAPTEAEVDFAERLLRMLPSLEQVRLVSSGTEATMSAIRLARGFTGRSKFIKFEGCYHGHADNLLVKAGSGLLTFGNPSSAGVPPETTQHTLVLDYNDCQQLEDTFARAGNEIACVIVEPVAGNMNLVRASTAFLQTLRRLCTQYGAVLIFDEVMTGFRVALGGAQSLYGIVPDLTTLGKVIGGGMPLAAFGGRRDIMAKLAPLGPVYQAGTLSGNPLAVACGRTTLELIEAPGFYDRLIARTRQLAEGLSAAASRHGRGFIADNVGSMFGLYASPSVPTNFAEVMTADKDSFSRFFHAMLDRGVYLAPSAYEAGFVSIMHDETIMAEVIAAANEAFAEI